MTHVTHLTFDLCVLSHNWYSVFRQNAAAAGHMGHVSSFLMVTWVTGKKYVPVPVGQRSNGSPNVDESHGSWVCTRDPSTHVSRNFKPIVLFWKD